MSHAAGACDIANRSAERGQVGYVDALGKRPGYQVVGDLEAPEWFLGCSKATSDHCVEKAARAHKLELAPNLNVRLQFALAASPGLKAQKVVSVIDLASGLGKTSTR